MEIWNWDFHYHLCRRRRYGNKFEENGISYQMYDNSFFQLSDIEKAQELADKFDPKALCRQLDLFAHIVNPYLGTIEEILHAGYHYGAWG